MAKKDDKKKSSSGIINRLSNTIQNNLDNLYSKTYYSQPSNKQDLESIKSKLDSSIDNIVSVNTYNTGKGTMSTLYARMQQQGSNLKPGDKESGKSLESLIKEAASFISSILISFSLFVTSDIVMWKCKIQNQRFVKRT